MNCPTDLIDESVMHSPADFLDRCRTTNVVKGSRLPVKDLNALSDLGPLECVGDPNICDTRTFEPRKVQIIVQTDGVGCGTERSGQHCANVSGRLVPCCEFSIHQSYTSLSQMWARKTAVVSAIV